MGLINPSMPVIGSPNSTEEPKVKTALEAIVAEFNGNIEGVNLDPTVLAAAGVNDGSSVRRGKSIIATAEATSSAALTTLTTPDRVSNIVLPSDGLIFVLYSALWKSTVAGSQSTAALFLGANQIKATSTGFGVATQYAAYDASGGGAAGYYTPLQTSAYGLVSVNTTNSVDAGAPVTTGQVIGGFGGTSSAVTSGALTQSTNHAGVCMIYAAAGTYDVSVKFATPSGTLTAKERKLWVWSMGFD